MGKQERSSKSKENAQRMKAEGDTRRTGSCPSCHRPVPLGGNYLSIHLSTCVGRPRARKR